VRLSVRNSKITDQAKDGGKKSFKVPSAREKVKEAEEPKVKVDQVEKRYGASKIMT
jgi:hypothetical protein